MAETNRAAREHTEQQLDDECYRGGMMDTETEGERKRREDEWKRKDDARKAREEQRKEARTKLAIVDVNVD